MNALMLDAEPHPPDVELREAMDATRGEGDPVVRPHRARQAELAEGAFEDRTGALALDGRQPPARQQIPRVLIADGERIAPHPVARGELPLDVGGPAIGRGVGGRRDDAGMLMGPAPAYVRVPMDNRASSAGG